MRMIRTGATNMKRTPHTQEFREQALHNVRARGQRTQQSIAQGLNLHGFRSTFRDWCSESTAYPSDVCEMALAHAIEDKSEAAYRRGDLLEKRRALMSDWAAFCGTVRTGGDVVQIRAKAA